jgi:hypothetical protein
MRPAHHGGASSDSESEPDHAPHDDDEEDNVIFTAKQLGHGAAAFRSRRHSKGITTAPGQLGAGETETEADEPVSICHFYSFLIEILTETAKTFTDGADCARFWTAGATKHSGASYHAAPVRGVPSALYCTSYIRSAVQSLQCVVFAHKWQNRAD